ncbi:MAG: SH3 domain-containing protein [Anaerolineae bacterium]|nr:SH3 domain-containing protein [Anaerolineae bacterium]
MTQYDAGPGDWSDRPWEDPDKKPRPQARRRVTLPPWALLAILVGVIILLCVGLVMIVQAIRRDGKEETPVPTATATSAMMATNTAVPADTTPTITPTNTVALPITTPEGTPSGAIIEPGVTVVVQGTQGAGLRLRSEPTTESGVVTAVREGIQLTVVDGPEEADGFVWWKVRTPDGKEGWGAANWLALPTPE